MTSLASLRLEDTAVTDAGLVHLKALSGLKSLNLAGTKVTESGVQSLKQSLPLTRISHWWGAGL